MAELSDIGPVTLTGYRADQAIPSGSVPIARVLVIFREATSTKVSRLAAELVMYARRPSGEMETPLGSLDVVRLSINSRAVSVKHRRLARCRNWSPKPATRRE